MRVNHVDLIKLAVIIFDQAVHLKNELIPALYSDGATEFMELFR